MKVRLWRFSNMPALPVDVGSRGQSGSRISGPPGQLLTRFGPLPYQHLSGSDNLQIKSGSPSSRKKQWRRAASVGESGKLVITASSI